MKSKEIPVNFLMRPLNSSLAPTAVLSRFLQLCMKISIVSKLIAPHSDQVWTSFASDVLIRLFLFKKNSFNFLEGHQDIKTDIEFSHIRYMCKWKKKTWNIVDQGKQRKKVQIQKWMKNVGGNSGRSNKYNVNKKEILRINL